MERYLIIKTRDELLRIKIGQILYFEADRNYTKLLLSNGIQFTFAINIGKIEEILEKQVAGCNIIRKSKFPQNPKRSVRFSGKRTKRSVQKRKARNTQKAETKVL